MLQLCSKRPISPDLVGVDFKPTPWLFHYKLPLAAVSSIANRGTGLALTGVVTYGSYVALVGDLPGAIETMKVLHRQATNAMICTTVLVVVTPASTPGGAPTLAVVSL
eukprot:scaffold1106_cov608-Prasinococcus_capsulatus_cf.AAC.4